MFPPIFCKDSFQSLSILHLALFCHGVQSASQTWTSSSWPEGTIAIGDTTHDGNLDNNDKPREYYGQYAIDGNTDSYWNDRTKNVFPDLLTVTIPSSVSLDAIIILSNYNGWLREYTVDTYDGSDWTTAASISFAENALQLIPFPTTVSTSRLRVNITRADSFSRVNEIYPIFSSGPNSTVANLASTVFITVAPSSTVQGFSTTSPTALSSSTALTTTNISFAVPTTEKKPNSAVIASGVFGGLVAILLVALAALLLIKKRKGNAQKSAVTEIPPNPMNGAMIGDPSCLTTVSASELSDGTSTDPLRYIEHPPATAVSRRDMFPAPNPMQELHGGSMLPGGENPVSSV